MRSLFSLYGWVQRAAGRSSRERSGYRSGTRLRERRRREQRFDAYTRVFIDPTAAQQTIQRGETRIHRQRALFDPARHFVDAREPVFTHFAVLIARREIGR
jgi:hypothetical protein